MRRRGKINAEEIKSVSRREFARNAMLAAASAAVLGRTREAGGQAEAEKPAQPKPRQPNPVAPGALAASATKPLSAEDRAEVEARMAAIVRRHGGSLSTEQKTDIQRLLREGQPSLAAFRSFPLDNADEPATILHLVRGKGRSGA